MSPSRGKVHLPCAPAQVSSAARARGTRHLREGRRRRGQERLRARAGSAPRGVRTHLVDPVEDDAERLKVDRVAHAHEGHAPIAVARLKKQVAADELLQLGALHREDKPVRLQRLLVAAALL